jgi:ribosomal protein L14
MKASAVVVEKYNLQERERERKKEKWIQFEDAVVHIIKEREDMRITNITKAARVDYLFKCGVII